MLRHRPHSAHEAAEEASKGPTASAAGDRCLGDECEAITREITGWPVAPAYLELVPVFRLTHVALDADRRQVGAANVFPRPLRVEVPARWRTCSYPGGHTLHDKSINVSALESMRSDWPELMSALLRIRADYLQRFPTARPGLTLGDVEGLSTLVLAVATYPLVRQHDKVKKGQLHPVLASMLRVSDGLRLTAHQMLFLPLNEPTLPPGAVVTGAVIQAYAERNETFHSAQGVCALPTTMIAQFLRVLVDGVDEGAFSRVIQEEAVQGALHDMQPAFDYGLLGLQALAVVISMQSLMTRIHTRMAGILQGWNGLRPLSLLRLEEQLREGARILQDNTFLTNEGCANRELVCADLYAKCATGLGDPVRQSLSARLAAKTDRRHHSSEKLRAILRRHWPPDAANDNLAIEWLVDCLMHCFQRTQEVLDLACEIQQRIDDLLGRAPSSHPFCATGTEIHLLTQDEESRRLLQLPHLLDQLELLLGLRVMITRDALEILDVRPA
jgi:hypothetical protein